MPRPLDDSLVGVSLGDWKLSRRIGQGAMGVVFEARGRDGTRAAVKIVHPEIAQDHEFLERFRREAHTLKRVQSENVVRLLDAGESEGLHYLALEFVEGQSIAQRLESDKRGMRPDQAKALAIDLLRGLAAVHAQGIVHRDVKPANVLLTKEGVAKLADFGLARRDEQNESIQVTQPGMLLGTPHYMSPEQCEGKTVTPRSDLYAAGAMLFHAIVGSPPFAGRKTMEILVAQMREKAPDLAKLAPEAPKDLVKLVMRLLEKKPELRPASARDALKWLGVENDEPIARDASSTIAEPNVDLGNAVTQNAAVAEEPSAPERRSSGSVASVEAALKRASQRTSAVPTGEATLLPMQKLEKQAVAVRTAQAPARRARTPWGKAFFPLLLAAGLVALFFYLDQVLAWGPVAQELDASSKIAVARNVRLYAPIAALGLVALGALRVLNGHVAAKAPARAPAKSMLARISCHYQAFVFRSTDPMKAADALRDLGELEAAAQLRLEAGYAGPAGDDFMSAGLPLAAGQAFERAKDHHRAIDAYVAAGAHERAAKVALESGQLTDAASLFVSARMFDRAVEAYRKARKPDKAAAVLEQAGKLKEAADELAQAYGDERAMKLSTAEQRREVAARTADLYERGGKPLLAARFYETAGDLEKAVELFERGGSVQEAARVAMSAKDFVRAVDLYESAGEKTHVARALAEGFLEQGRADEAAEELEKIGDLERAAQLYEHAGDFASAARCVEASGDGALAADLYARGKDYAKAAALYEKALAWREAASSWREVGDAEKESRAHERAGNPIRAAEVLIEAKKDAEAVRVLSQVSESSSDRGRAVSLLGDVHAGAGRHKEAVLAYGEALDGAAIDASSAPRILRYADSLRALGRLDEATKTLERLRGSAFAPADLDSFIRALTRGTAKPPSDDRTVAMGTVVRMGGGLATGTEVDRYRLLSSLGEGGFAWVYKAEHTFLRRIAALKVLKPLGGGSEEEEITARFLEEGRAVAALRHPNLIEVYDCGRTSDGLLYMALEFVNGVSLRKLMKEKGALPLERAAKIGSGILAGAAAAHRAKIVHRDLKPENILVDKNDFPKVLDFGIAKAFHGVSSTRADAYLGTPRYSSPEQALGKEVGPAADQYAIGLLLYEMLAGRPPFESTTPLGYLTQHAQAAAPSLAKLAPNVPPELVAAVMRSLEKEPEARHPDVDAFRRVVASFVATAPKKPPAVK